MSTGPAGYATGGDDLGWLCPPNDVHDAAKWDAYWKAQLDHGLGPELFDMFCDVPSIVDALEANRFRSVLCVGSGISMEPQALADAGFDVTALDLSSWAMGQAEKRVGRSGRRPRYLVGDLMDPLICPGPFDMVIERKTLQLFPEDERAAALRSLAQRLAPRGIFFSHCHDGRWKPPAKPFHATRDWFGEHGWKAWQDGTPVTGHTVWLFQSTG
jgi:SAM-dependent methyltransferase